MSLLLHAAAIAAFLVRPGRSLPRELPPLEVEMIQQTAQVQGAAAQPEVPPPAETPPAPATQPSPPAPALPRAQQAPAPSAPAAPSSPAARTRAPPKPPLPAVNLGNGEDNFDPLTVTSDDIKPPAPDARYRNLPPHYPPGAARNRVEGTVQLVAHVATTGQALSVGIVSSSGNAELDEEARRAVLLWRFRPAMDGRKPVPYDYVLDIRFALDK